MTTRIKRMLTGAASQAMEAMSGSATAAGLRQAQEGKAERSADQRYRLFTEKQPLVIVERNVDYLRKKDGSYGAPIHRGVPRKMQKEFERKRRRSAAGRWAN